LTRTACVDRVLPGPVVGDTGHPAPAELDVADCNEARTALFELTSTPDAVNLVTVALGNVDVRAVRLHPRPPSLLEGIPRLFVGVDGKVPASGPEQDAIGVVVPGKREQHVTVRADEVRLPVRRVAAIERDDDILVRSRPVDREFDASVPDPPGQLEHPLRAAEVSIVSLRGRGLDGRLTLRFVNRCRSR
jgi:hypothetical protein